MIMILNLNVAMLGDVRASKQAVAFLARHGIQETPQRVLVVQELAREHNDVTAAGLHDRLRRKGANVGLATVYRTLALLQERSAVDTFSHHAGELCYRLCADDHHHHLVCTGCHRVVELPDCDLEPWVKRQARRHGFAATGHEVEIRGLCAECRWARRAPKQ
jgi:Fur family transcriptional regulator, ferric uptake regulator